ncbi:hypothetical protein SCFA_370034 [anaerobic digester metagenome]|uniref:Uncharacterized protein n=1 Tax=anaerobic digester metagenome TaxID=1263854 RepID=A0A485M082_9ZZZZ
MNTDELKMHTYMNIPGLHRLNKKFVKQIIQNFFKTQGGVRLC